MQTGTNIRGHLGSSSRFGRVSGTRTVAGKSARRGAAPAVMADDDVKKAQATAAATTVLDEAMQADGLNMSMFVLHVNYVIAMGCFMHC